MNDTEAIVQLLGNITAPSILVLVAFAFLKGWVVPASIQIKIDAMQGIHDEEIANLREEHSDLQDKYRTDMLALQEKRIEDLEAQLLEREARVEQGMKMLSSYKETQDRFSALADLVKDKA